MKSTILRSLTGALLLWVMVLASSCGGNTQNTNPVGNANTVANGNGAATNANASANSNGSRAAEEALTSSLCNGTDIQDKQKKIQDHIDQEVQDDQDLWPYVQNHALVITVVAAGGTPPTYLDMYVEGWVGKDGLPTLLGIIKNFMKKGCAEHVYLVAGAYPKKPALAAGGFIWGLGSCEDPEVPCPGGFCYTPPCPSKKPKVTDTTNTNLTTKPANTSANSNKTH